VFRIGRSMEEGAALLLAVLPAREQWVWTLTDGAGLAHAVGGTPALARAEALSHLLEHGGGGPADAAQLAALLYPGAIGEALAQVSPRPLVLQLHPSLDRLAWELAWVGRAPVGQRFAVARHPVLDEELPPRRRNAPTPAAALRVLRLLPAGTQAGQPGDSDGFDGETRSAPASADGWATHDVLLLPRADCDGWARLPTPRPGERRCPPLVVATVTDPAVEAGAAHGIVRQGATLLVARHDTSGALPPWWAALVRQLADGVGPDVAVRQIRRDLSAAWPVPSLRLYGDGGTPLRQAGEGRVAIERRQVTALSVDLVGSTRLLHTLGAERYSSMLQSFHDLVADVMHRHGGVADDPQGDDGLMSYFGHPVAAEDAAPRAVGAALVLVQAVAELGFEVRIGVATGPVAIQNDTPVGVSIHLAARLQNQARAGAVLVSDSTRQLLGGAFEVERLPEPLVLKGIAEEQTAWRVTGRRAEAAPGPARDGRRDLPMVGREDELQQLLAAWQAVRQGGRRVVVVQGEAGIGKSRLLRELRKAIAAPDARVALCQCLPDARSSPFFAVTVTLRRMLGLTDAMPPEQQLATIEADLPASLPRAESLALAAALFGLPMARPAAAAPPERRREQTLDLLLRWFEARAGDAPVCLVVEDTHWIDPSTRELLNRLARRDATVPLLLVTSRRPDDGAGWEPPAGHEPLVLRGLQPSAARWLVRQACGDQPLSAAVVRLLAARGDGVPLFLEESVRMALDAEPSGAAPTPAAAQLAAQVPATLQDLLMARIDRLAEAKPTAQLAAALGRSFPRTLLAAVAEREFGAAAAANLPARLASLERAGLLLNGGEGDHAHLTFRHALLRDTAYGSLWQRDRRRVHRVVAEVLNERFAPLVARQPELLAYHLAEAGDHAAALSQWESAARLAIERWANDEAIAHLESALAALAQLPADTERDRLELRLQTQLAARCIAADGYGAERVERVYARASALCLQLADRRAQVRVDLGLHAWHFMHADFARAHQIAQRAMAAAAEAASDPVARIQARWSVGITLWHQGQLPQAVRLMDECLVDYQPAMHRAGAVQNPAVMCGCYSGWGRWELGHPDDALSRVHRALALGGALDHKFSIATALGFASSVHHFRGETEAALDHAQRAIAVCEEGGFTTWLAHARMMRGRLRCELGRHDEGLAEMHEAYRSWVDSGAQVTRPLYLAMQAEGLALAGRPREGLRLLHEALLLAERTGERYHEAELRRLHGTLTLAADGAAGAESARRWFEDARELAARQGKAAFVLRAALELAALDPAAADLPAALAAIDGGLGTRDVDAARTRLAERGIAWPTAVKGSP
jgi:class 3 adenylate cyclase